MSCITAIKGFDPDVTVVEFRPELPQPLFRELPPAGAYPVSKLGPTLSAAAEAIHDIIQAPIEICAQSVLAAATLAAQAHADVVLPHGAARPLSCFFLTIAASGERKSSADGLALRAVREREKALRQEADAAMGSFLNAHTAWEAARKKATQQKGTQGAIKVALDAPLGPEPGAPLTPILTVAEPTLEGLIKLLAVGQPSVGVFAAEGGQFLGSHGMTQENKLRTATGYSALWDGEAVKRVRVGDGVTVLPNRRVSMHLMAQPEVSAVFLSDRLLADQGLLSRFLISYPPSAMGTRLWRDPSQASRDKLASYNARLTHMLRSPMPLAEGTRNELAPRPLPFSLEARALWIDYANNVEERLQSDGAYHPITGLANKLGEHAARLAAVLTLVDDLHARQITGETLAAGIALAEYYAGEALRLHMSGAVDPKLADAEKLRLWCLKQPTRQVSVRDISRRGPNSIRVTAKARELVQILLDHGWLTLLDDASKREVYRVHGHDL